MSETTVRKPYMNRIPSLPVTGLPLESVGTTETRYSRHGACAQHYHIEKPVGNQIPHDGRGQHNLARIIEVSGHTLPLTMSHIATVSGISRFINNYFVRERVRRKQAAPGRRRAPSWKYNGSLTWTAWKT